MSYFVEHLGTLTLWGLCTWKCTSPSDWALFGDFFILLNQSFILHGSQFSSLFTILKSTCPSDHNVIFCLHHHVHDARNDITMTPPWCYNRGTYMSFQSLTREGHICPCSPVRVKKRSSSFWYKQSPRITRIRCAWFIECRGLVLKVYSAAWLSYEYYNIK